ncbi:hypothetical protein MASR2M18_08930 [Ignavibacteria bacterium]|nr:50S ribosomal protein L29 [Bacteroidota bacterium]MCZ2132896.1 50S ribosomal protein L29 [Bacteroidota bacterium]
MKPRSPKDLRELSDEELQSSLWESNSTLTKLRFQSVLGQLHDTAHLRVIRKDIARIKTLVRERELETEKLERGLKLKRGL